MGNSNTITKRVALTVFLVLLSAAVVSTAFVSPTVAQSNPVEETTVSISGSVVTVDTGGVNSIAVENLPSDASITNISDGGTYNADEGSILYSDFGSGLPAQVTFTLDPDDSAYAAGDIISFTADGTSVSLDVVSSSDTGTPPVPDRLTDFTNENGVVSTPVQINSAISAFENPNDDRVQTPIEMTSLITSFNQDKPARI